MTQIRVEMAAVACTIVGSSSLTNASVDSLNLLVGAANRAIRVAAVVQVFI